MLILCVFIFGLIVGSFLNVCIYRMPRHQSIAYPPSHCTECGKSIPFYDNIPVLSYVLRKGLCRFCFKRISPIYPVVEIITGILFTVIFHKYGLTSYLPVYFILVSALIVATFIDFEHQIIPDEISIGGMVVGLILATVFPPLLKADSFVSGFLASLFGLLAGGGSIYILGLIGELIFKKEAMGGGDVKLMAMIGSFLGWEYALLTFFVAPFFGAIVGIIAKYKYKESVIPYGPYLSIAAFISLIWGNYLINYLFPYRVF